MRRCSLACLRNRKLGGDNLHVRCGGPTTVIDTSHALLIDLLLATL